MALDHSLGLFAHRFYVLCSMFFCFSYSYLQTDYVGQLSGQLSGTPYNSLTD